VRFNLADVPKQGNAALIVALAGSNTAHLAININGKKIADYTPPLDGGNALLRQGSHAKYSTSTFSIPLSKLHKGENAIDFTQSGTRDNSAIFWDYLALEMPGPK
jgi:rhamnogalacturonan endolyase